MFSAQTGVTERPESTRAPRIDRILIVNLHDGMMVMV
jgi:hypothetical protein